MIKYRKDYKYVCSTEGTEQILPTNESDVTSLSPVMDITYGNGGELLENQHFTYRQTAGGEVSDIPENVATVQAIRGQSVVWNQMIPNSNFANSSTWTSGLSAVVVISNNVCSVHKDSGTGITADVRLDIGSRPSCILGHKYLFSATLQTQNGTVTFFPTGTASQGSSGYKQYSVKTREYYFWTAPVSATLIAEIRGYTGSGVTSAIDFTVENYILIDLTLMFGAGNEPATAEEFEAWLAANVGLRDYYPYDEGTILGVKCTGIKTTGFNQWDEEWEVGAIASVDGRNISATNRIRSKNYIPVFGRTAYYLRGHRGMNYTLYFYDVNKNYLGVSYQLLMINNTFTTPSNASYVRFNTNTDYGETYKNDSCINISDPNKNGTYEPYFESTLPIEVTTMTGKLNGAGQSVTIFPDGMNRVGNIYDEVYVDNGVLKAVKRLGVVDMGNLAWSYNDSIGQFRALVANVKTAGITVKANSICTKYPIVSHNDISDKTASIYWGTLRGINIIDSAYSDNATFKTAMSGVMLVYELETPLEYIVDVHKDLTRRIINANDVQKVYIGNDLIWEKPVLE